MYTIKSLAIDLGASSGRLILGKLDDRKKLHLEEIYRFPNGGVPVSESLYWDIISIFREMKMGLAEYVNRYGNDLDSIGIDTWGVDFVLLDEKDEFIGPIHHYRDKRTDGMLEKMLEKVSKEEIFSQTGIQFLQINGSTQIFSMVYNQSSRLSITKMFLMLPDFLHFLLSGVKKSEFSDATTSQLYNPTKKDWAYPLIEKLGLKKEWFCPIVQPGTVLGKIKKDIAEETGINKSAQIITPLTHDTGSAVAAVPIDMGAFQEGEWAYLSSGTWSLLGVELKEPLINKNVMEYNFTNEGGIGGSIRFLKNLSGLWIIQECKKVWDKEEDILSWDLIAEKSSKAPKFQTIINPDDPMFLNPPNMIEAIRQFCAKTGQDFPEDKGSIARTVFESLALRYKHALLQMEELLGKKVKILHVIGGGSQNNVLNQFTASALQIPLKAGPKEATAIGNLLVQMLALGEIEDVKELRQIVRDSFPIKEFEPKNSDEWEDIYQKYKKIL